MNKNDMAELTQNCFLNIVNMTKDEEESEPVQKIELTNENLTDFFTANLLALGLLYKQVVSDTDLIGFTHILNRLAIQHQFKESFKEKENE